MPACFLLSVWQRTLKPKQHQCVFQKHMLSSSHPRPHTYLQTNRKIKVNSIFQTMLTHTQSQLNTKIITTGVSQTNHKWPAFVRWLCSWKARLISCLQWLSCWYYDDHPRRVHNRPGGFKGKHHQATKRKEPFLTSLLSWENAHPMSIIGLQLPSAEELERWAMTLPEQYLDVRVRRESQCVWAC